MKKWVAKHPYWTGILLALLIGFICTIGYGAGLWGRYGYLEHNYLEQVKGILLIGLFAAAFLIYPLILTVIHVVYIFWKNPGVRGQKIGKVYEYITIILGILYSSLVLIFYEIEFMADWTETLYNNQLHTPIYTVSYPTIILLGAVAVLGYLWLSLVPVKKMSPLMVVFGFSAMYIGIIECALWIWQVFALENLLLCLFPFNCILIAVKTIVTKIREWGGLSYQHKKYKNPLLNWCSKLLSNGYSWPFAAFVLMWPLLGILICILVLLGQEPDAAIRAWTETSDWNLSQRVAPQNVFYDEHYLCTVAAGGHKQVVKPVRMGERHGHKVVVNRQLCIANAFEQILEEKTPTFHRHVRNFYDTYGFPVARLIHSPYIADVIYILMKPLEWFFLLVLYLVDVKPEDRIAVQYLPLKFCQSKDRNLNPAKPIDKIGKIC